MSKTRENIDKSTVSPELREYLVAKLVKFFEYEGEPAKGSCRAGMVDEVKHLLERNGVK